jgi:hypothetical protein
MTNQSSALLINEEPLQLLPSLALAIADAGERADIDVTGLNEALVLQQLHYWLRKPKVGVVRDGRKWVYNSYTEWKENFPFWSERTILRIFANLEKLGLVDSEQPDGRNRKKQYAVNYAALNALIKDSDPLPETHTHTSLPPPPSVLTERQDDSMHDARLSLSDSPSCQDASCQVVTMEDAKLSSPSGQLVNMFKDAETTTETTREHTHTASPPASAPPARAPANGKPVCVCSTSHRSKLCDDERIRIASNMPGVNTPDRYAMTLEARRGTHDAVYLNHRKKLQKPALSNLPERDTSACPDCAGTGFWEPGGKGKGVAKCQHPRLDELNAVEHGESRQEVTG